MKIGNKLIIGLLVIFLVLILSVNQVSAVAVPNTEYSECEIINELKPEMEKVDILEKLKEALKPEITSCETHEDELEWAISFEKIKLRASGSPDRELEPEAWNALKPVKLNFEDISKPIKILLDTNLPLYSFGDGGEVEAHLLKVEPYDYSGDINDLNTVELLDDPEIEIADGMIITIPKKTLEFSSAYRLFILGKLNRIGSGISEEFGFNIIIQTPKFERDVVVIQEVNEWLVGPEEEKRFDYVYFVNPDKFEKDRKLFKTASGSFYSYKHSPQNKILEFEKEVNETDLYFKSPDYKPKIYYIIVDRRLGGEKEYLYDVKEKEFYKPRDKDNNHYLRTTATPVDGDQFGGQGGMYYVFTQKVTLDLLKDSDPEKSILDYLIGKMDKKPEDRKTRTARKVTIKLDTSGATQLDLASPNIDPSTYMSVETTTVTVDKPVSGHELDILVGYEKLKEKVLPKLIGKRFVFEEFKEQYEKWLEQEIRGETVVKTVREFDKMPENKHMHGGVRAYYHSVPVVGEHRKGKYILDWRDGDISEIDPTWKVKVPKDEWKLEKTEGGYKYVTEMPWIERHTPVNAMVVSIPEYEKNDKTFPPDSKAKRNELLGRQYGLSEDLYEDDMIALPARLAPKKVKDFALHSIEKWVFYKVGQKKIGVHQPDKKQVMEGYDSNDDGIPDKFTLTASGMDGQSIEMEDIARAVMIGRDFEPQVPEKFIPEILNELKGMDPEELVMKNPVFSIELVAGTGTLTTLGEERGVGPDAWYETVGKEVLGFLSISAKGMIGGKEGEEFFALNAKIKSLLDDVLLLEYYIEHIEGLEKDKVVRFSKEEKDKVLLDLKSIMLDKNEQMVDLTSEKNRKYTDYILKGLGSDIAFYGLAGPVLKGIGKIGKTIIQSKVSLKFIKGTSTPIKRVGNFFTKKFTQPRGVNIFQQAGGSLTRVANGMERWGAKRAEEKLAKEIGKYLFTKNALNKYVTKMEFVDGIPVPRWLSKTVSPQKARALMSRYTKPLGEGLDRFTDDLGEVAIRFVERGPAGRVADVSGKEITYYLDDAAELFLKRGKEITPDEYLAELGARMARGIYRREHMNSMVRKLGNLMNTRSKLLKNNGWTFADDIFKGKPDRQIAKIIKKEIELSYEYGTLLTDIFKPPFLMAKGNQLSPMISAEDAVKLITDFDVKTLFNDILVRSQMADRFKNIPCDLEHALDRLVDDFWTHYVPGMWGEVSAAFPTVEFSTFRGWVKTALKDSMAESAGWGQGVYKKLLGRLKLEKFEHRFSKEYADYVKNIDEITESFRKAAFAELETGPGTSGVPPEFSQLLRQLEIIKAQAKYGDTVQLAKDLSGLKATVKKFLGRGTDLGKTEMGRLKYDTLVNQIDNLGDQLARAPKGVPEIDVGEALKAAGKAVKTPAGQKAKIKLYQETGAELAEKLEERGMGRLSFKRANDFVDNKWAQKLRGMPEGKLDDVIEVNFKHPTTGKVEGYRVYEIKDISAGKLPSGAPSPRKIRQVRLIKLRGEEIEMSQGVALDDLIKWNTPDDFIAKAPELKLPKPSAKPKITPKAERKIASALKRVVPDEAEIMTEFKTHIKGVVTMLKENYAKDPEILKFIDDLANPASGLKLESLGSKRFNIFALKNDYKVLYRQAARGGEPNHFRHMANVLDDIIKVEKAVPKNIVKYKNRVAALEKEMSELSRIRHPIKWGKLNEKLRAEKEWLEKVEASYDNILKGLKGKASAYMPTDIYKENMVHFMKKALGMESGVAKKFVDDIPLLDVPNFRPPILLETQAKTMLAKGGRQAELARKALILPNTGDQAFYRVGNRLFVVGEYKGENYLFYKSASQGEWMWTPFAVTHEGRLLTARPGSPGFGLLDDSLQARLNFMESKCKLGVIDKQDSKFIGLLKDGQRKIPVFNKKGSNTLDRNALFTEGEILRDLGSGNNPMLKEGPMLTAGKSVPTEIEVLGKSYVRKVLSKDSEKAIQNELVMRRFIKRLKSSGYLKKVDTTNGVGYKASEKFGDKWVFLNEKLPELDPLVFGEQYDVYRTLYATGDRLGLLDDAMRGDFSILDNVFGLYDTHLNNIMVKQAKGGLIKDIKLIDFEFIERGARELGEEWSENTIKTFVKTNRLPWVKHKELNLIDDYEHVIDLVSRMKDDVHLLNGFRRDMVAAGFEKAEADAYMKAIKANMDNFAGNLEKQIKWANEAVVELGK